MGIIPKSGRCTTAFCPRERKPGSIYCPLHDALDRVATTVEDFKPILAILAILFILALLYLFSGCSMKYRAKNARRQCDEICDSSGMRVKGIEMSKKTRRCICEVNP